MMLVMHCFIFYFYMLIVHYNVQVLERSECMMSRCHVSRVSLSEQATCGGETRGDGGDQPPAQPRPPGTVAPVLLPAGAVH